MTNTLALWLGGLIVLVFAADALFLGLDLHLILMRTLAEFIRWVAFWR